ncbi:hypothetical protein FQR65_LT10279 [Abscondita terminalis]|nr:hypothetical protein FQR65_LT10279 [Abscondita terminalis]
MGEKISMPIGVAPTAMQRMAHPDGECATAKAAQEKGTIYILSTISTSSIEEIAEAAPEGVKWFQLYVYKNREITKQLVQRAEIAGFKAIVLTVDAPVFGLRLSDVRNKFALPPHLKLANFEDIDKREFGKDFVGSGINEYVAKSFDATLTWDDLKWLQNLTKLPILLKGILTAEDAVKAADMGVAGVIVSNHGARQVDGVPASIEALPEIAKAVGHRIDVYVDGGFRDGVDVFKALTLGAKMVFVGRPILWGLSYDGQKGVKKVLDILGNELDNALALTVPLLWFLMKHDKPLETYLLRGGLNLENNSLRIRPRVLRDVADRDLSVSILGEKVPIPIGIAPTSKQKMAHPDGECATAKAAQEKGTIFILSTFSNTSIEEIAKTAPSAIKWLQLYVCKDREFSKQLIQRAENAGFKAIVITVDAQVPAIRYDNIRNNYSMPSHLKLPHFEGIEGTFTLNDSLTWKDLDWLRSFTKLPILLKGILTAEDAVKAADIGVAGIIVSNHGARQLDSVPATIEALPEIAKAVGNRIDVFVDGGFREGVDVFKALALGAKMVFVGRPILWGLSYDGQKGVKKVLDILENELDNALALSGCTSIKDMSQDMVVHKSYYTRLLIRPRVLRDVARRDLSVTILGEKVTMPIGIAPTGKHGMAHPDGECATARAAQEKDTIFILATSSNTSIEEIARVAPLAIKWFQLYVFKNREISKQLIQRAEKAGFKAIVITVDAQVAAIRYDNMRNHFLVPSHLKLANFEGMNGRPPLNDSLTWNDLGSLQSLTKLPILLKGILTAEDAVKAADMGVAGVIVSNHGGRQLDSVPATIEALPEIVKAVGHRIEVFVDGGFREGVDVFKALAFGAKMVFIGRPVLWGLCYDGEKGVKKVLDILENELDNTFALSGCTSVQDISRDMVVHKDYYKKFSSA